MSELSCPNCHSTSIDSKDYLAIPRLKKLKMTFCALCCGRRYCGNGIYKRVCKCRTCGWKCEPFRLP